MIKKKNLPPRKEEEEEVPVREWDFMTMHPRGSVAVFNIKRYIDIYHVSGDL